MTPRPLPSARHRLPPRQRPGAQAVGLTMIVLLAVGVAGCSRIDPTTATARSGASATMQSIASRSVPATGRPTGSSGAPRGGLPDPAGVEGARPDAVARWVLNAWCGYDTALDYGPSDTARRAVPLLTPALATTVRQAAPIAAPGAAWNTWARAHAYATVHLTPSGDDHPPDSALQAYRSYLVEITLHAEATTRPVGQVHLVGYVELARTRPGDPWRAAEVFTR